MEQAQELFSNRLVKNIFSLDVGDFDILQEDSLEDGAATITKFTANIIGSLLSFLQKIKKTY